MATWTMDSWTQHDLSNYSVRRWGLTCLLTLAAGRWQWTVWDDDTGQCIAGRRAVTAKGEPLTFEAARAEAQSCFGGWVAERFGDRNPYGPPQG